MASGDDREYDGPGAHRDVQVKSRTLARSLPQPQTWKGQGEGEGEGDAEGKGSAPEAMACDKDQALWARLVMPRRFCRDFSSERPMRV